MINRSERDEQGKGISPLGTAKGLKTILPLPTQPQMQIWGIFGGRGWSGMQRDLKQLLTENF